MNQVSSSNKVPKTERGRRTRNKLLEAAEIEFGEKGFHEAGISGITYRAGVALGTFYTYFESKEEIFRALVRHMSRLTRKTVAEKVAGIPDRLTTGESESRRSLSSPANTRAYTALLPRLNLSRPRNIVITTKALAGLTRPISKRLPGKGRFALGNQKFGPGQSWGS